MKYRERQQTCIQHYVDNTILKFKSTRNATISNKHTNDVDRFAVNYN